MLNKIKPGTIIWIAIALCIAPFAVYIIKFGSNPFTNETDKWGQLGDFIGGISDPLIALASAILLYMALTKQIESHVEVEKTNQLELIFKLLNELDLEIKNFFVLQTEWNLLGFDEHIPYPGIQGLFYYVEECVKFDRVTRDDKEFFKSTVGSQFVLWMNSCDLIVNRIESSSLDEHLKMQLKRKLQNTYRAKLKYPFNTISVILQKQNISAHSTKKMIQFHTRMMAIANPE